MEDKGLFDNSLNIILSIMDTLPVGVFIADKNGDLLRTNEMGCKIWGGDINTVLYRGKGIEGLSIFKGWWYVSKEPVKANDWPIARAVSSGEICIGTAIDIKRFDGKTAIVFNSASPILDSAGNIIGGVAVLQDLTYQKTLEKELVEIRMQKQTEQLERLDLLSQMVNFIGNEVKRPIETVQSILNLLGSMDKYKIDKEHFDLMIGLLNKATNTLHDFLYLSKDKQSFFFTKQDINSIILKLLPSIQEELIKADIKLTLSLEDIPPLMLDEKEIGKLILNLVRSSLETMEPRKHLSIRTFEEQITGNVVLVVKDQGRGIPKEILQNLESPFMKEMESEIGLRLSICYNIAQKHNAKLEIETSERGTTSYIIFHK